MEVKFFDRVFRFRDDCKNLGFGLGRSDSGNRFEFSTSCKLKPEVVDNRCFFECKDDCPQFEEEK